MKAVFVVPAVLFASAGTSLAQAPYGDISDLKIAKAEDRADIQPAPAAPGAFILFDGKNLDQWLARDGKKPAGFKVVSGNAMEARGGDIITREKFGGPFKLHVEFRVPYLPTAQGQGRGNSGVYLQGRYEVQILDSYGLKSQNNDCGAIYGVSAPLVNACKAPTVWQSYDIAFQPPQCPDGKKTKPARVTVYQNGIKIQHNVAIPVNNTTAGLGGDPCAPGPILLQYHGNPVQFRNVWLVKE
jgi:Domain of Unknown Function (DUF1080)